MQLYYDITNAFENGEDYFLGNIILAKSRADKSILEIIDGQQRMVTLWLMLKILSVLLPSVPKLKSMIEIESWETSQKQPKIESLIYEAKDDEQLKIIIDWEERDFIKTTQEGRLYRNAQKFYEWLSEYFSRLSEDEKSGFWKYCIQSLYLCRQYNHNLDDPISKIKTDFDNDPSDINGIANRLRRKFENMISEFAQFTLADTHSETKELLRRLLTDSPIYINASGNGINRADELVSRIQETCRHCQPNRLPSRIQTLINQYDHTEELKPIRDLIKTMKLYQKVILHQGSHSQPGIPTITTRELNLIFPLMSKLETSIHELLRNANVYRM